MTPGQATLNEMPGYSVQIDLCIILFDCCLAGEFYSVNLEIDCEYK